MTQNINEIALDYINDLKRKRHMSTAELANLTGINDATLARLLSGKTSAPSFENMAELTIALGGSLDVMIGLRDAADAPMPTVERLSAAYNDAKHQYEERLADKRERIDNMANDLKIIRKEKYTGYAILGTILLLAILVIATYLVMDISTGQWGVIRY